MPGTGIAITTSVDAAAVGVQAVVEGEVGGVVFGNDGLRFVVDVLDPSVFESIDVLLVPLDMFKVVLASSGFEPIRGIELRAVSHPVRCLVD